MAPHTPNPWGHVELVLKTWVLGSGNWVRLRSAKLLCVCLPPFGNLISTGLIPVYRQCRRFIADGPMPWASNKVTSTVVVSTRNRSPSPSLARHRFATDQGRLDSRGRFLQLFDSSRRRKQAAWRTAAGRRLVRDIVVEVDATTRGALVV